MRCADCRTALSAWLDGEDLPGEADAVEAHVAGCRECAAYRDRAARVNRLARTQTAESGPDLVPVVLEAATPVRRRRRLRAGPVRVAVGAVGIGQCALAISEISLTGGGHGGVELIGASAAHLSHESSAWSVALAVGFLWVAVGTSRPAGLVPLIGGFVGVLTVLSLVDVADGRVEPARLLTHLLVVIGFALLVVLQRITPPGAPDTHRAGTQAPTWPPARLRSSPRADRIGGEDPSSGLQPSAHRRVA